MVTMAPCLRLVSPTFAVVAGGYEGETEVDG